MQDLGGYLRECRRQAGVTQAQLAVSAKVSRRWLSDLEAGKATAEFGLVLRTLHALGIVVDLQPEARTASLDLDAVLDQYRTRGGHPPPSVSAAANAESAAAAAAAESAAAAAADESRERP
jgi:y4mF family transcriptional regulator